MGWCYQSRDPLRRLNPMRQLPLYRTVESVFGPSPRVRAEAELRIATNALAAEQAVHAEERRALGEANRRPMTTRRWWQGQALRALNHRRARIRAARRRLDAARAAVDGLTPADDFASPWLAAQAGIVTGAVNNPIAQAAPLASA
jgi:hypothetical protein